MTYLVINQMKTRLVHSHVRSDGAIRELLRDAVFRRERHLTLLCEKGCGLVQQVNDRLDPSIRLLVGTQDIH